MANGFNKFWESIIDKHREVARSGGPAVSAGGPGSTQVKALAWATYEFIEQKFAEMQESQAPETPEAPEPEGEPLPGTEEED